MGTVPERFDLTVENFLAVYFKAIHHTKVYILDILNCIGVEASIWVRSGRTTRCTTSTTTSCGVVNRRLTACKSSICNVRSTATRYSNQLKIRWKRVSATCVTSTAMRYCRRPKIKDFHDHERPRLSNDSTSHLTTYTCFCQHIRSGSKDEVFRHHENRRFSNDTPRARLCERSRASRHE